MLMFNDVSLFRGGRCLFAHATFNIYPGHKAGITGANGTGKSSLFALVRDELHADSGEVALPRDWVLAHVAQEVSAVGRPAIDYVMDGDHELRSIEAQLQQAEQRDDGQQIAELHTRLDNIDGYNARSRASRLLHGLGFAPGQELLPVNSFSGGWRMRLNLAQALMCRSDLLLLDEPTNHLDLDAVIWLEEWLRAYPGTLLLISHDREFLDAVVGQILHLEQQKVTLYSGNYSAFERRRAEQLAQQQAAYEKQQREMAHIQSYVDRFRAKASKARQAQSRLKALQRMEQISAAHVDSPFHFSFRQPHKIPHPLLTLEQVAVGYNASALLTDIGLSLVPGDRIGLLGPNGAGKSTLMKLLAGELAPLTGQQSTAPDLRIGYFAQHQLEQLQPGSNPLQHLLALDPRAEEQKLRDFLGGFGFVADRVKEPVDVFSGGEKARLVLALLVYQRPNLLLMDEPTNHLDLEMRHALTMALQEFAGAMVIVSHDRSLLSAVTDRLLLVADGRVMEYDGDLHDYARWLAQRRAETNGQESEAVSSDAAHTAAARKEQRRTQAQQRQSLQPLKKALAQVERRMERLNAEKVELEQQLADSAVYQDSAKDQLKQLLTRQREVQQGLSDMEAQWLDLSEQLEAAQDRLS